MKPAQRDVVLALLRDAGPRGVHTFELRAKFIGNPSQRIAELEERGHAIEHRRERLNGEAIGSRYVLKGQAVSDEPRRNDQAPRDGACHAIGDSAAGSSETATLFDPPAAVSRPAGAYDEIDEAA